VPFQTYETFGNASVRYDTTYQISDYGLGNGYNSYYETGDEDFISGSYSSGSYSWTRSIIGGDFFESSSSGTTAHNFNSYTLQEKTDTTGGPLLNTSGSASGGVTSSTSYESKIGFIPNVGIPATFGTTSTTYYFSDFTDESNWVDKLTTTGSILGSGTDSYYIQSTTQTTLTDTILGISTTWTDVTTTSKDTRRTYTEITSSSHYGIGVGGEIDPALDFSGEALIIQPHYGQDWTQDGSVLQYLQIFTSVGSYGPTYSSIFKDNIQTALTFPADKSFVDTNVQFAMGLTTTYTAISSSAQTITYDYLTTASDTLTFSTSFEFDGIANFYTNSSFETSRLFAKAVKTSSTFSQLIQDEYLIDAESSESAFKHGLYTAIKAIQVFATDQFYAIDQVESYFSSFTYRGIIKTTTQQTYVVYDAEIYGSSSSIYTTSGSNSDIGLNYTNVGSFTQEYGGGFTYSPKKTAVYKQFYSLEIGAVDDAWRKYYTQYSPNFNFVVGGTSNSIGGYKALLSPTSAITKLYFTTYKFERNGVLGSPTLAIPINYTSESDDGTNSSYTYQSVNVPNEFCLGSSSASVYWTKSVAGSTTNTTSSFMLFYSGSNTILTMGELTQNDFSGGVGEPLYGERIYHTNGLVNTASGASWSKDGYYYWRGTSRATSGSTANAISAIGNGEPITFIASQLVPYKAYPVVSILKNYANSYSY